MTTADQQELLFLKDNAGLLASVLKVSHFEAGSLSEGGSSISSSSAKVRIERAGGKKCPRCWNYSETIGENSEFPEICPRCADAVSKRRAI